MPEISFIGAGNIATCLINGLVRQGYAPSSLHASDPGEQAIGALLVLHPEINAHTGNVDAAMGRDVVVVCVKPGIVRGVCEEIAPVVADAQVISVAAGVPLRSVSTWLGAGVAVTRCMPNTPIQIGQGMSVLCANDLVSDAQREAADKIFSSVGDTMWLESDRLMDLATAVSGSGPAYLFRIMEALIRGACQLGLPENAARRLITQTTLGSAALAARKDDLAALRKSVTSKGGTTERGLLALQEADIDSVFLRVLQNAYDKARELSTANRADP